ncbi:MAG: hypothetical protein SFY95_05920 [Planctomycetota bacterium]|nr:hypothetical protein [Planctomycetota bacterium]
MRRAVGFLARWLGRGSLLAAWLGMLAWLVGHAAGDRTLLLQYLNWVPTLAVIFGASALLIFAGVFFRAARRSAWSLDAQAEPPPDPATWKGPCRRALALTRLGWLALFMLVAWLVAVEWRIASAPRPGPASRPFTLRTVFWNQSKDLAPDASRWVSLVAAQDPDLVMLTDPPGAAVAGYPALIDAMRPAPGAPMHSLSFLGFSVISRVPILAWGGSSLGLKSSLGFDPRHWVTPKELWRDVPDPGRAMWLTLETTPILGKPITVWILDLPSDLGYPREQMMRDAAAAIAAFRGPMWVFDSRGAMTPSGSSTFPPADMMVGDFNTPRGARSLRHLTAMNGRSLEHGFDIAGRGHAASFPGRWLPLELWHIDHGFVSPEIVTTRYTLVHTGISTHALQAMDVRAR